MGARPRTYVTGQLLAPVMGRGVNVGDDLVGREDGVPCTDNGATGFQRHRPVATGTWIDHAAFQGQWQGLRG